MKGRIVEISGESRHLSLNRGFLVVREGERQLGRIDLDTILAVIICSRGASFTNTVLAECASRLIPVLICDNRFQPVSIMVPTDHHFDQNRRYHAQALLKKGGRDRLWQSIVKAKISNQAAVLATVQSPMVERLKRVRSSVKSGDSTNAEAQAAQVYWRAFFGKDFRRDKDGDGINALLNYGYAIIRSAMTRAVFATGLHPTFGLHHSNQNNAFCLVDDLMEPYRPLVDQMVHRLAATGTEILDPPTKGILARLVLADSFSAGTVSPLGQQMLRLCQSLLDNIEGNREPLLMPDIFTPVELAGLVRGC